MSLLEATPYPQCLACKHLRSERKCEAFPDGIPAPIWENHADHRKEFPGDAGIRFDPESEPQREISAGGKGLTHETKAARDPDFHAAEQLVARAKAAAGDPEDSPESRRLILQALIGLAEADFKADGQRLVETLKPLEGEPTEKAFLRDAADKVAEWKGKVGRSIRRLFLAGALILSGGPDLSPEDVIEVDRQVGEQAKFLDRFAQQILDGEQPLTDGLPAREAQYASSGWAAAWNVEAKRLSLAMTLEKWELGYAEHHCPDCPGLAALGWVVIGTLPPLGSTACGSRCRCWVAHA